jgi:putative hydrolase of the HAD superfamily
MKPRAILFDLDDTLIAAYGRPEAAWRVVIDGFAGQLTSLDATAVTEAIARTGRAFWADPDRHKMWRMRLSEARRQIVTAAFVELGRQGYQVPAPDFAAQLADRFSDYRDEQMSLFPNAHAVIDELKRRGFRLGLVTNGATIAQRGKITRFDLAARFDHIQVEEEVGFGKPDARSYHFAMEQLGVAAGETWMIGDNLEWEVAAPQRLGIFAVWHDSGGQGLPASSPARPDLVIHTLPELLPHLL